MATTWLIRNNKLDEELESGSFVSIGWDEIPDLNQIDNDKESLTKYLSDLNPNDSLNKIGSAVGTLRSFHSRMKDGDVVIAPYDNGQHFRVGVVDGDYYFDQDAPLHKHRRRVRWGSTSVPKTGLSPTVQNGLRNISTLSRVNQGQELFEALAHGSEDTLVATPSLPETNTWLVGAVLGGEDYTEQFVREGQWRLTDGLNEETADMKEGDKIAIKSTYVRKYGLSFENSDLPVSCMKIKARGTISKVHDDYVSVDWDSGFEPKEWYFYTNQQAVWKLNPAKENARELYEFIFDGAPQNLDSFLAQDAWARYKEAAEISPIMQPDTHSFRVARPSAAPIYEAADKWRHALIEGKSLFSGEPFDYQRAVADLVSHFTENPLTDGRSFMAKLKEQLGPSSTAAVQLASELLYMYFLPAAPRSIGKNSKLGQLNTISSWKEDAVPVPESLQAALDSGIAVVGTIYNTRRWEMLNYLIRFTETIAALSRGERETSLTNWDDYKKLVAKLDEQTVWSVRFLLEHVLFPDLALPSSSRDDRERLTEVFADELEGSENVNDLRLVLIPNLRYGEQYEIAPYYAPLRYGWKEPDAELALWSEWALFVDDEQGESKTDTDGEETAVPPSTDLPNALSTLTLISSPAARQIEQWARENRESVDQLLSDATGLGLERFTDLLAEQVGYQGSTDEWIEAASAIYATLDPRAPRFFRSGIPVIRGQLSSVSKQPGASPGEQVIALNEGLDGLSYQMLQEQGVDLDRRRTARLVQTVVELDPANTSWDEAQQTAFLDWREGRKLVSPYATSTKPLSEKGSGPESGEKPEAVTDSATDLKTTPKPGPKPPQTLEELAKSLSFTSDESLEWLKETRDLLQDRKQMILQGPPGTGKTHLARQLALFLAKDNDKVTTVQFHPVTSYEDFVQGLRPNPEDPSRFHVHPGPLLKAAKQAADDSPDQYHVLIVDEINRANLPAVFGELYFLLEYRDEAITLNYGDQFSLPPNLLIIGTMNTADRSIAAIDAALRRRFVIRDLRPGEIPLSDVLDNWLAKQDDDLDWLADVLALANERINDRDQHVGPSHFLRTVMTEQWARRAWDHTVMPMLEEHFYGQPDRIESLRFDALKSAVLKTDDDSPAE